MLEAGSTSALRRSYRPTRGVLNRLHVDSRKFNNNVPNELKEEEKENQKSKENEKRPSISLKPTKTALRYQSSTSVVGSTKVSPLFQKIIKQGAHTSSTPAVLFLQAKTAPGYSPADSRSRCSCYGEESQGC